jgi:hypothetical protein
MPGRPGSTVPTRPTAMMMRATTSSVNTLPAG